ncbi:MAG TPA: hypothetical protein VIV40_30305 [Kofleriaceae bacterium]
MLAIAFVLFLTPEARAYYEYNCGGHRDAQCHEEPRADEDCYNNQCYGRCGPGCGWSVLGNTYTDACQSHDACIQYERCTVGSTGLQSHQNCAYALPAAVNSFVQTHWNQSMQWAKDTWSGVWTKIKNCCG